MLDFKNSDYRGFVFAVHADHGMMLLHCTRKKKKGPHFQLPGGHVDAHEFGAAEKLHEDPLDQLLAAARMGAARELFEETGMDIQRNLDRLKPATLRSGVENDRKTGSPLLGCELRKRLYFFLSVTDEDFIPKSVANQAGLVSPIGSEGKHLMLQVSVEHSGFMFVKEPTESVELLKSHSGGAGSEALRMAMNLNDPDQRVYLAF
mmetsp:Transcript_3130/g.5697  ORF Transcript_3130/g.5697 Transcript_3130/m.5697 type:complete len:205 (-) Transcript_3130:72-686(-)